jgi:copper chaperone CopZ
MYGDHHVTIVRNTLLEVPGVSDVWASAAFRQVSVSYDPETVTEEAIASRLADAGYAANGDKALEETGRSKDPAWETVGVRVTTTFSGT